MHPYDQRNGADTIEEEISSYSFPYPQNAKGDFSKIPLGGYDAMWKHTPFQIQTFFNPNGTMIPIGLFELVMLIALGFCVFKIFFDNIKRGGILLIQIAVGSLHMFSIPRGYDEGFNQWVKQVIALFFEVARVAAAKRPALLYLENVQNLLSHDKGWTFETILEVLDDIGYDVSWTVLNSANFGVPQSRNRVFITGFLRGRCAGEIFAFSQANPKTLKQRLPGREGNRVYDSNGLAITLTSSAGGFGGRTGLYILPIKSKTKIGYCICYLTKKTGGTAFTVNYAFEKGLVIYNVHKHVVSDL